METLIRTRLAKILILGIAIAGIVGAALVSAPAAPLQDPPPETPPMEAEEIPPGVYVEEVAVRWVLVPVVVRGRSGYIQGLEADAFRLYVDGMPVTIESFDRGKEAPVSIHLLQDTSGSMANAQKLNVSWRILSFFLNSAQDGDEFAVTTFAGGKVQVRVPFTTYLWDVRKSKREWNPYGVTALHDAVAWLPELTLGSRNAKRVALLVTDGVDNASVLPPGQARELVRGAELPVYALGLRTPGNEELKEDGSAGGYRYGDVLRMLAEETGGRYAAIEGPRDVRRVCSDILEDLRHQYVLGFRADGGSGGENSYRQIRVEVKGRKRTAIHRRGYRGAPPNNPIR